MMAVEPWSGTHRSSQVELVVKGPPAMSLSKLCAVVKDREAWRAAVHCHRKESDMTGVTEQPPPVFLPGESHGQRCLASYSPQGHTKSDTTEPT